MGEVNIVYDLLLAIMKAKPSSGFVKSLHQQYCERGGLSKKQLEGLHNIGLKTEGIAAGQLATLAAIIKKRPTRDKEEIKTKTIALPVNDQATGKTMEFILEKYPQHKRILFLKLKYDNKQLLDVTETAEVQKFAKLLLK
ncbi:MAG: hypothetical protein ABJA78_00230 [Ferruginibacter sp.]